MQFAFQSNPLIYDVTILLRKEMVIEINSFKASKGTGEGRGKGTPFKQCSLVCFIPSLWAL